MVYYISAWDYLENVTFPSPDSQLSWKTELCCNKLMLILIYILNCENEYAAVAAALKTVWWISTIATTILTGTVYLYIYLVTHFSGTKVDVTKFSQILPLYTETINAVFKKIQLLSNFLQLIQHAILSSNKTWTHESV